VRIAVIKAVPRDQWVVREPNHADLGVRETVSTP
jgi:hypothetical protein